VVTAFERVADGQAEARAVAQRRDDLLLQPGGVDHHLAHAAAREGREMPLDQRLAAHAQQRLRAGVGQRPHAFAAAGGEDDRFHGRRV
jgi:hypothetical protein